MLNLVHNQMDDLYADQVSFDDFWLLYARHEAKKDALKAWAQIDPILRLDIIVAAAEWRRVWAAQGRSAQFIKLPASWLRGECWTDEVPSEFTAPTRNSHKAAQLPEDGPRTAMPAHVKALLDKLRAK